MWYLYIHIYIYTLDTHIYVYTHTHTHTHTHIYIYTHEYYSAIKRMKRYEVMSFAETWMDLEIILSLPVRQRKLNIAWSYLHAESEI